MAQWSAKVVRFGLLHSALTTVPFAEFLYLIVVLGPGLALEVRRGPGRNCA